MSKINISKKLLMIPALIMVLCLMLVSPVSAAFNADTPYTVTTKYIIPSDSTFTVALAGSETTIDFNPAGKDSVEVQPDSQNASATTPIAVVTNAGNLNMDFSINLTAAKPSWVVLKASSNASYGNSVVYDTVALSLGAWDSIPVTSSIDVFLWADFTQAPAGTTERTFQINTAIA